MSYAVYVCDTETTGTDPTKHDVIEVCFWRIGDEESKTWCLRAVNVDEISDEALHVNKHKREDILQKTEVGKEKYLDPKDVLPEIEMWFMEDGAAAEERILVGQNPKFDYDFLLALWRRNNAEDTFPFGYWRNSKDGKQRFNVGYLIDTINLARIVDLCTDKKRPYYNLKSLVNDFGVTKATAHRADGDVKMTKELFEKIIDVIRDPIRDNLSDCYPE
jgi:DNA polymerase III epsilon subunit-like protein